MYRPELDSTRREKQLCGWCSQLLRLVSGVALSQACPTKACISHQVLTRVIKRGSASQNWGTPKWAVSLRIPFHKQHQKHGAEPSIGPRQELWFFNRMQLKLFTEVLDNSQTQATYLPMQFKLGLTLVVTLGFKLKLVWFPLKRIAATGLIVQTHVAATMREVSSCNTGGPLLTSRLRRMVDGRCSRVTFPLRQTRAPALALSSRQQKINTDHLSWNIPDFAGRSLPQIGLSVFRKRKEHRGPLAGLTKRLLKLGERQKVPTFRFGLPFSP